MMRPLDDDEVWFGQTSFGTATVAILVASNSALFYDDFARCAADPYSIQPWQRHGGDWSLTGGVLCGSRPKAYGYVYIDPTWTNANYSVEARVQLSTGAYGAGVGGRLNTNGGHYAAWIYPKNSGGGSNLLKLVKFSGWESWSYNGSNGMPMAVRSLASVGSAWHTLTLSFTNTNYIEVYYNGTNMISMADTETNSQPHTSGGVSLDVWGATMWVSNVVVKPYR